mmetsp:Transcript_999/g.3867  ORF Transcript_999/g.3867 Transcript_999/m.3867 type:complete len:80 (-) Transcript_999:1977-2216(-)
MQHLFGRVRRGVHGQGATLWALVPHRLRGQMAYSESHLSSMQGGHFGRGGGWGGGLRKQRIKGNAPCLRILKSHIHYVF